MLLWISYAYLNLVSKLPINYVCVWLSDVHFIVFGQLIFLLTVISLLRQIKPTQLAVRCTLSVYLLTYLVSDALNMECQIELTLWGVWLRVILYLKRYLRNYSRWEAETLHLGTVSWEVDVYNWRFCFLPGTPMLAVLLVLWFCHNQNLHQCFFSVNENENKLCPSDCLEDRLQNDL